MRDENPPWCKMFYLARNKQICVFLTVGGSQIINNFYVELYELFLHFSKSEFSDDSEYVNYFSLGRLDQKIKNRIKQKIGPKNHYYGQTNKNEDAKYRNSLSGTNYE